MTNKSEVYSAQSYIDLDIEQYRTRFPAETKPLTDKTLFDIVMLTDDNMDDKEWQSLFLSYGKPNRPIGDTQTALCEELANVSIPMLDAAVEFIAQAKEDYQGGPVKVYFALCSGYSPEQIASMPRVGTNHPKSDPDYVKNGGTNPDYYKVPSWGKNGKRTEKTVSFYVEYANRRPSGQLLNQKIDWIERAGDTTGKSRQDDIPAEIKALNPHERSALLRKLENRRGTIRSAYKDAVKLGHQLDDVNALAHVACSLIPTEKEGEFENVVLVRSTIPGRETMDWEHFSIKGFMRLDADKAAETEGGTLASLKATQKREKPDDSSDTATGTTVAIKTVNTYAKVMNDVHAFMDEVWTASDKGKYSELLRTLGPRGGAGTDLFAGSMYSIYTMLKDIYSHEAIEERGSELAVKQQAPAKKVA
jgi:hypothetical protein